MGTFESNLKKFFGHYDYNNNATVQTIPITTWTKLTNNGLGIYTDTTQKVTNINNLYNISTQQFDFTNLKIGDVVKFRFTGIYNILSNNTETSLRMNMAVGNAGNYPIDVLTSIDYKTTGTEKLIADITITMDNQYTIDYPAQLEIWSDSSVEITVTGYKIFVEKRSL